MSDKNKHQESEDLDINESFNKAEGYVKENKKSISLITGAIVVVILGYFGYTNFVVKPQEENAQREMFMAERYFQNDSMQLALNGDGQYMGFLEIIDSYGSSQSANLSHYYAGMCYMHIGEWQNAIDYLSGYDAEDDITGALALGAIGDAHMELGDQDEAESFYRKAADWDSNNFTAPMFLMKVAFVRELKNDFKTAAEIYERIKTDYPQSTEARDVERFLVRATEKAEKG